MQITCDVTCAVQLHALIQLRRPHSRYLCRNRFRIRGEFRMNFSLRHNFWLRFSLVYGETTSLLLFQLFRKSSSINFSLLNSYGNLSLYNHTKGMLDLRPGMNGNGFAIWFLWSSKPQLSMGARKWRYLLARLFSSPNPCFTERKKKTFYLWPTLIIPSKVLTALFDLEFILWRTAKLFLLTQFALEMEICSSDRCSGKNWGRKLYPL